MTRDYAWLLTAIPRHLNKTASVVPTEDLIAFGEADLAARLDARQMTETLSLTLAQGMFPAPDDLKGIEALTLDGHAVDYFTPERFDAFEPCGSEERPYAYTLVGDQLLFKPEPVDIHAMVLRYRRGICSLSNAKRSDWLQCQRPAARLYAALVHSAPYLEDDERLGTWERMLQREVDAVEMSQPSTPTKLRAEPMFQQHTRRPL